jgi:hypothetical protein|tara:strand:- start:240 stop:539 length:300 start_codon:yes stop_codon:yes gene_type:complete
MKHVDSELKRMVLLDKRNQKLRDIIKTALTNEDILKPEPVIDPDEEQLKAQLAEAWEEADIPFIIKFLRSRGRGEYADALQNFAEAIIALVPTAGKLDI